MFRIAEFWTCACLAFAAMAQTSATVQFEVASVKPSQAAPGPLASVMARMVDMMPVGMIPMPDPGAVHIQNWPLKQIVAAAYRVRGNQVSGPAWIEDANFDIEAKLPADAKRDEAHEMLQALLAERFGLVLHRDRRELAGFALVVGKGGPRLEPAVPPAPPTEAPSPAESQDRQKEVMARLQTQMQKQMKSDTRRPGSSRSSWQNITMSQLADNLRNIAGGPVVDETGIEGKYHVVIETWRASDEEPEQTVFNAVEKLGLKLAPRKVPVDILVIDKLSKTPTAN